MVCNVNVRFLSRSPRCCLVSCVLLRQMFIPFAFCRPIIESASIKELFQPRRKLRPRRVAGIGAMSLMPQGLVMDENFEIAVQARPQPLAHCRRRVLLAALRAVAT